MLQSLFKAYNFIEKRLQHRCFPVNIAKLLRTPILKNICEWLLLYFWNPNYKSNNVIYTLAGNFHFQF